jgi:tRNA(Ile)-lysidine synthase
VEQKHNVITAEAENFFQRLELSLKDELLLVAVSGGADSVCLLYQLKDLKNKFGFKLHVVHLNHGLRGEEARADALFVENLAKELGLPATIGKEDTPAYKEKHRLSLEEAARQLRYSFFCRVAAEMGASIVAVGHTTDDHIETVLLHILRGSGTRGLKGLEGVSRYKSDGRELLILRPLLKVSRRQTAACCVAVGVSPRLDSSNLSLSPLRNKVRLKLLPLLKEYNPQVEEALGRVSRIAVDDIAFIDGEVERYWDGIAFKQGEVIIFQRKQLMALPLALRRGVLRKGVAELLGSLKDVELRHIEEMLELIKKPAGRRIDLPGGLVFAAEYDRYLLGSNLEMLVPFPELEGEHQITLEGVTIIPGWRISARLRSVEMPKEANKNLTAYLDYGRVKTGLKVRSGKTGDRFQPLGLGTEKKLSQFLIDSRVPRDWRQRIPLLCSGEDILWLVGYRLDERVKVTAGTKKILKVEFKRV